jgi:hypothetical protein
MALMKGGHTSYSDHSWLTGHTIRNTWTLTGPNKTADADALVAQCR